MRIVLALLMVAFQVNVTPTLDPSGAWELDRDHSEWPADDDPGAGGAALQPAEHLVIRLTPTTVTFYDDDGLRRLYRLFGADKESDQRGGVLHGRARWDGAGLRIERRAGDGVKVIETYAVDPEARRLTVTVVARRNGLSTARRIRYVYNPLLAR